MSQGRLIAGTLIIIFGLGMLLDLNVFRFIFPALVIWIGLMILLGHGFENRMVDRSPTEEDKLHRVLIFSGIDKKIRSSNFSGGEVVAIFGGGEIDLSEVKVKQKKLDFSAIAIFGGLKIIVPSTWTVHAEGVGILGGFDNRTKNGGKKTVDVYLKGTAIIGGVEITN